MSEYSILTITLPSAGVPGVLLNAIEDGLREHYKDTPAMRHGVKRIWNIEIRTERHEDPGE